MRFFSLERIYVIRWGMDKKFGKWVSVEKSLPPLKQLVLVCNFDEEYQIWDFSIALMVKCLETDGKFAGWCDAVEENFIGEPQYWMPFPEAPDVE